MVSQKEARKPSQSHGSFCFLVQCSFHLVLLISLFFAPAGLEVSVDRDGVGSTGHGAFHGARGSASRSADRWDGELHRTLELSKNVGRQLAGMVIYGDLWWFIGDLLWFMVIYGDLTHQDGKSWRRYQNCWYIFGKIHPNFRYVSQKIYIPTSLVYLREHINCWFVLGKYTLTYLKPITYIAHMISNCGELLLPVMSNIMGRRYPKIAVYIGSLRYILARKETW